MTQLCWFCEFDPPTTKRRLDRSWRHLCESCDKSMSTMYPRSESAPLEKPKDTVIKMRVSDERKREIEELAKEHRVMLGVKKRGVSAFVDRCIDVACGRV